MMRMPALNVNTAAVTPAPTKTQRPTPIEGTPNEGMP
jgi:hypothetical protein